MNQRKKAEVLGALEDKELLKGYLEKIGSLSTKDIAKKETVKSNTTIFMLRFDKGVLCAADRQVTLGSGIESQEFLKIEPIGRAAALMGSGSVRSMQVVTKIIRSVCESFKAKTGYRLTTAGLANRIGELCSSMMYIWGEDYFSAYLLLAGVDEDGEFEMFDICSDGSVMQNEKYLCSGSGSINTRPILDKDWKEDMTIDEAIGLAVDCLYGSGRLDSWSSPLPQVPPFMITITKEKLFDLAPQKIIDRHIGRLILKRPELAYILRCILVAKV